MEGNKADDQFSLRENLEKGKINGEMVKAHLVLNLVVHLLQLVPLYGPTYGPDKGFHSGIGTDYKPPCDHPRPNTLANGTVTSYYSWQIIRWSIGADPRFVRCRMVCSSFASPGPLALMAKKKF
jgi:hypothetical protein